MLGYIMAHTIVERADRYSSFVMEKFKTMGTKPDLRDYHAVMSIQLRVGDVRKVSQWYEKLLADGSEPDVKVYTILLAAYAKTCDKNLLWTTWEQMVERLPGSEVDMDARAVMVEGLGRAGDIGGAEMLVEDIERALRRKNGGVIQEKTLFANIQLYEALIRTYGVNRQLQAAKRLFRTLAKERPDFGRKNDIGLNTLDAVLEACSANNDFDSAVEFWDLLVGHCKRISAANPPSEMSHRPRPFMIPLPSSYDQMMLLYSMKGDVEQVQALFDEKRSWYQRDVTMFKHLINAHMKKRNFKDAVRVYDEMVEMDLMPDVETVEVVMNARRNIWGYA